MYFVFNVSLFVCLVISQMFRDGWHSRPHQLLRWRIPDSHFVHYIPPGCYCFHFLFQRVYRGIPGGLHCGGETFDHQVEETQSIMSSVLMLCVSESIITSLFLQELCCVHSQFHSGTCKYTEWQARHPATQRMWSYTCSGLPPRAANRGHWQP